MDYSNLILVFYNRRRTEKGRKTAQWITNKTFQITIPGSNIDTLGTGSSVHFFVAKILFKSNAQPGNQGELLFFFFFYYLIHILSVLSLLFMAEIKIKAISLIFYKHHALNSVVFFSWYLPYAILFKCCEYVLMQVYVCGPGVSYFWNEVGYIKHQLSIKYTKVEWHWLGSFVGHQVLGVV